MKVKDLIRKLNLISDDCQDYEVFLDTSPAVFLEQPLEKVYVGGAWNIMLSSDCDDEDIEDNEE